MANGFHEHGLEVRAGDKRGPVLIAANWGAEILFADPSAQGCFISWDKLRGRKVFESY